MTKAVRKHARRRVKEVMAWGYFNRESGKLAVRYQEHPMMKVMVKVPELWRTRNQARQAGYDRPHWQIVRVTITVTP